MTIITSGRALAGCLVVALLASCGQTADELAWWELEQERIRLSQRLELLQYRLEQAGPRPDPALVTTTEAEAEQARRAVERLGAARARLSQEVADLGDDLVYLRKVSVQQRRELAIGQVMEKFQAAGGRTYLAATIVSIGDAGVALRHRDGSARLRFPDLTKEQQEWFGLESEAALAAEEAEHGRVLAYENWISGQMATARDERERKAAVTRAAAEADKGKTIRAAAMAAQSQESRLWMQAARQPRVVASVRPRYPRQRSTFYTYYHVTRQPRPCVVRPSYGGGQLANPVRTFPSASVPRPPVIRPLPVPCAVVP